MKFTGAWTEVPNGESKATDPNMEANLKLMKEATANNNCLLMSDFDV